MVEAKPVRIGELLTRAGVLRKQDLQEAIEISQDTGQMIGKVLIMSGFITKEDLQAAVEAQSLVRDGNLEFELALLAIATCSRERLELVQALDQLGWHPLENHPSARLGELLLAAEVITIEQLDAALEQVHESIIPLGAVLIQSLVIDRSVLDFTLEVQSEIRAGKITKLDGVERLQSHAKTHP
ncbi:hypothetical protein BH11CYA1_BH11CYA1_27320 [soil metagenome]